jgi:hypothetical protein
MIQIYVNIILCFFYSYYKKYHGKSLFFFYLYAFFTFYNENFIFTFYFLLYPCLLNLSGLTYILNNLNHKLVLLMRMNFSLLACKIEFLPHIEQILFSLFSIFMIKPMILGVDIQYFYISFKNFI